MLVRILYDDREKFPWVLWAGDMLWGKYRTREGAIRTKHRLQRFLIEVALQQEDST